jgi:hypothetical protein
VIDPDLIAAAERDLGRLLAAYRQAAGYTQTELSPLTGYSRSSLANVETGRQSVPRGFWERCDTTLGTGGVLVARYDRLQAVKTKRRHEQVLARQVEREARLHRLDDDSEPASGDEADDVVGVPVDAWGAGAGDARRHATALWAEEFRLSRLELRDAVAASSVALHWLVASEEGATGRDTGWRRIGWPDIQRLHGVRRQLKAMDNAYGGGVAFPMAVGYLRGEVALITALYDAAVGRALFGVVAQLSHDVGWMAYDAGDHRLASRYFGQALRLAHAAGDRLFGGRVLAAMSHQALHIGFVQVAVDLARAARTGTERVAPPTAAAMLAAMETMAQAAGHDRALCTAALVAAEAALDRAGPGDDNPDWLDFDVGGLLGHAARAYRYLRQGKECARFAEDSIARCSTGHGRTRAQRLAILAAAHVQLGNLDEAAAVGLRMVVDAWQLHSRHVDEEVAGLVRALDGTRATTTHEFLDQAREYLVARRTP